MITFEDLDRITVEDLQATGATRWVDPDGAIGAFTAEMDYGVADAVTDALHEAVDSQLFAYMPPRFKQELKDATAQYVKEKCAWDVDPAHVHEVPDVIAALEAAITHFSAPGSKIIVPTPAYMPFLFVPPTLGREVIEVPMIQEQSGRYVLDLDAIEAAFRDGGNLLVMCNPHNPTGTCFTREELEAVAELVERNSGRVFSDEIWLPLVLEDVPHIPYASVNETAANHSVTAIAASKAFNVPGLKCAQLITSNEADRKKWLEVGQLVMHGAANLGVVATIAAYERGDEWLNVVLGYLKRNRDFLLDYVHEHMPGVKVHCPQGTYVAWLDFREAGIEGSIADHFRAQANVILTDGTACGRVGEGFARLIFAMPKPVLEQALGNIAAALPGADKN